MDFGHDVPEEGEEARGDKDPVESDRVALPEPLLLELWLMEANAKGRVPERSWSVSKGWSNYEVGRCKRYFQIFNWDQKLTRAH